MEVVDDGRVVVFKSLDDLAESIIAKGFHLVVPSGKIESGLCRFGFLVEDVYEFKVYVVCLLQFWEHLEEDGGPCLLLGIPLRLVHEDDVTAACHDLRLCLSVFHPLRFPFADKVFFWLSPKSQLHSCA